MTNELVEVNAKNLAEAKAKMQDQGREELVTNIKPRVVIAQGPSKPVKQQLCELGDLYMEAAGHNFGDEITFVVLKYQERIKQFSKTDFKCLFDKLMSDCDEEEIASASFPDDWQPGEPTPMRAKTHCYLILEYSLESHEVDPNGLGPMFFDIKGTSHKIGGALNGRLKTYKGNTFLLAITLTTSVVEGAVDYGVLALKNSEKVVGDAAEIKIINVMNAMQAMTMKE